MRDLKTIIVIILLLAPVLRAEAAGRTVYNRSDSVAVVSLLGKADGSLPAGRLALWFARQLLGRPYVGQTLEGYPDAEHLVVNTRQLDCTTLVETVVALTLCSRQHLTTFADYCRQLQRLRYRGGRLDGYNSRLHYFSDWIADKTAMGIVSELQQPHTVFAAVQTIDVSYMSTHTNDYAALRRHPELTAETRRHEQALTGHTVRYIPKTAVVDDKQLRNVVCDGDIIAITTNKKGLDIAHLGFAVWTGGHLHLLNASQLHKKVVEEPMTLGQYLQRHPLHTGIRVIRLNK